MGISAQIRRLVKMKQELEARELIENIAEEVRSAAADARLARANA